MSAPIKVYSFEDAPRRLRNLSTNGGDEDWLAVVPAKIVALDLWMPWLETPAFGASCVDRHLLPDGRLVLIGCHA